MRKLSLGALHSYVSGRDIFPKRLSGRILLDVEDKGKAYYINPLDLKKYYLGRPADAFDIVRRLGIGITNDNLRKIGIGELE
jgi:hypothetical protein